MATTYTSTIDVNVWKEHTCLCCGTVYRYLFKRTKSGQGATPDAAAAAAHNAVIEALTHEVDMQPCPGCGSYQPDMIASVRASRHWWMFAIGLPFFALFIILVLADVLSITTGAYALALTAGLLLMVQLGIDLINPNASLEANQALATQREEDGEIWVPSGRKGEGTGEPVGSGVGSGHNLGYALLILGALAFLLAPAYASLTGAHLNSSWSSEVISPGEEPYVYFNESLTAVKGYWNLPAQRVNDIEMRTMQDRPLLMLDRTGGPRSNPEIRIANWRDLGLDGPRPALSCRSKASTWQQNITIGDKESTTSTGKMWAYVKFPDDPRLAGKPLDLEIEMTVLYPKLGSSNSEYFNAYKNFSHRATVTLTPGKAGAAYLACWWFGVLAGCLLSIAGGITLPLASSAFRHKALPTDIFVPDENKLVEGPTGAGPPPPPPVPHDEGAPGRYRLADDEAPPPGDEPRRHR